MSNVGRDSGRTVCSCCMAWKPHKDVVFVAEGPIEEMGYYCTDCVEKMKLKGHRIPTEIAANLAKKYGFEAMMVVGVNRRTKGFWVSASMHTKALEDKDLLQDGFNKFCTAYDKDEDEFEST